MDEYKKLLENFILPCSVRIILLRYDEDYLLSAIIHFKDNTEEKIKCSNFTKIENNILLKNVYMLFVEINNCMKNQSLKISSRILNNGSETTFENNYKKNFYISKQKSKFPGFINNNKTISNHFLLSMLEDKDYYNVANTIQDYGINFHYRACKAENKNFFTLSRRKFNGSSIDDRLIGIYEII